MDTIIVDCFFLTHSVILYISYITLLQKTSQFKMVCDDTFGYVPHLKLEKVYFHTQSHTTYYCLNHG